MRKRDYVSPTALKIWQTDPEKYYNQYLVEAKIPREPQTPAMAVGSAFDAFVKSYLHDKIYGPNHKDAEIYDLDKIFESQVEKHNRIKAREEGSYVFSAYKDCGALADLMYELDHAASEPRFEVEIRGALNYSTGLPVKIAVFGNCVLLGKPDIYFINDKGAHCIFDWKVGGLYSKGNMSPMAGYKIVRDCHLPTKNNGMSHKDYIPMMFKGMEIDGSSFLESRNSDWAAQLCTYGWLLGESVGSESVVGIDQIVGQPMSTPPGTRFPYLRVASHRTRVSREFQIQLAQQYQELWKRLHELHPLASGEMVPWFFRELTVDESWAKCGQLDKLALDLYGPDANLTEDEQWLVDSAKGPSRYFGPSTWKPAT